MAAPSITASDIFTFNSSSFNDSKSITNPIVLVFIADNHPSQNNAVQNEAGKADKSLFKHSFKSMGWSIFNDIDAPFTLNQICNDLERVKNCLESQSYSNVKTKALINNDNHNHNKNKKYDGIVIVIETHGLISNDVQYISIQNDKIALNSILIKLSPPLIKHSRHIPRLLIQISCRGYITISKSFPCSLKTEETINESVRSNEIKEYKQLSGCNDNKNEIKRYSSDHWEEYWICCRSCNQSEATPAIKHQRVTIGNALALSFFHIIGSIIKNADYKHQTYVEMDYYSLLLQIQSYSSAIYEFSWERLTFPEIQSNFIHGQRVYIQFDVNTPSFDHEIVNKLPILKDFYQNIRKQIELRRNICDQDKHWDERYQSAVKEIENNVYIQKYTQWEEEGLVDLQHIISDFKQLLRTQQIEIPQESVKNILINLEGKHFKTIKIKTKLNKYKIKQPKMLKPKEFAQCMNVLDTKILPLFQKYQVLASLDLIHILDEIPGNTSIFWVHCDDLASLYLCDMSQSTAVGSDDRDLYQFLMQNFWKTQYFKLLKTCSDKSIEMSEYQTRWMQFHGNSQCIEYDDKWDESIIDKIVDEVSVEPDDNENSDDEEDEDNVDYDLLITTPNKKYGDKRSLRDKYRKEFCENECGGNNKEHQLINKNVKKKKKRSRNEMEQNSFQFNQTMMKQPNIDGIAAKKRKITKQSGQNEIINIDSSNKTDHKYTKEWLDGIDEDNKFYPFYKKSLNDGFESMSSEYNKQWFELFDNEHGATGCPQNRLNDPFERVFDKFGFYLITNEIQKPENIGFREKHQIDVNMIELPKWQDAFKRIGRGMTWMTETENGEQKIHGNGAKMWMDSLARHPRYNVYFCYGCFRYYNNMKQVDKCCC